MKLQYNLLFTWSILVVLLCSCKEDTAMNYYHRVTPVVSVSATFADGADDTEVFTTSQSEPYDNEIEIDFPYFYPANSDHEIDVSNMELSIVFHEEVEVVSTIPSHVDFTQPLMIDIINADGTEEQVVIKANIQKSNQAQITGFSFPGIGLEGAIIESAKIIGIDLQGKDLSNLSPTITVSGGATISPDPSVPQNFNEPVTYTVTAQDGTEQHYTVDDIRKINIFEIHKGVNVASWLSTPKYEGAQRVGFFNESDVQLLARLGFDHIRLLVDEEELWDQHGGRIREYGFDLLHEAIGWCIKHGVRVIVDLHITRNHRFTNSENPLFTDPSEPAKFVKLWEDLSDELGEYPNSLVAYELLNEPVSKDPANWNEVAALAIEAIRAKEADRTIIVGVCTSNNSVRYDNLTLPSTHRILLTFHYYGPFLLTAYGLQSTTGGRTDIPIQYPGQLVPDDWISALPENWQSTGQRQYNRAVLADAISKGIQTAERLNVPVFMGEFGTLNTVPEPSRSNWYRDVIDILDEYGQTPYTSFDYKGAGYSIVDESRDIRYPAIVDLLTR